MPRGNDIQPTAADPDAELQRLYDEWYRLDQAWLDADHRQDEAWARGVAREEVDALKAVRDELIEQAHEALQCLLDTPARTVAGLLLKLLAADEHEEFGRVVADPDGYPADRCIAAAIRDARAIVAQSA